MQDTFGKVITFYSYKGGVGRSMALANIAVLLSQWGKKVLMLDWDLEAPGLEYFFFDRKKESKELEMIRNKKGVIDLLIGRMEHDDFQSGAINWDDYEIDLTYKAGGTASSSPGTLKLITSGQKDTAYIEKVRRFNYSEFYDSRDGGIFLEEIRAHWISGKYDYVLIDSRTGLTESGGVCTIHMPDILLLLFTPNEQSLRGVMDVAARSLVKHTELSFERYGLFQLFIPTRFDDLEFNLKEEWVARIDEALTPLVSWLPYSKVTGSYTFTIRQMIGQIRIPYKARYAYGEKIAVLEEGISEPGGMGYVFETITAIIGNEFASIGDLNTNRDLFVKRAKGEAIAEHEELLRRVEEEKELRQELQKQLSTKNVALDLAPPKNSSRTLRYLLAVLSILIILFSIYWSFAKRSSSQASPDAAEKNAFEQFKGAFADSSLLYSKGYSTLAALPIYARYDKLSPAYKMEAAPYKKTLDSIMQPVLTAQLVTLYKSISDSSYSLSLFADTLTRFDIFQDISARDIFRQNSYFKYLALQKKRISAEYGSQISVLSFKSDSGIFTIQYFENIYTLFPNRTKINTPLAEVQFNYDLKITSLVPVKKPVSSFEPPMGDSIRVYILSGRKDVGSLVEGLKNKLDSSGFNVVGAKYLLDLGRPDRPEIRYFNAADQAQAEKISVEMQAKYKDNYPANKYTDANASAGYIEIWLGR